MLDIRKQAMRGVAILEEGKFQYDRSKYINASEALTCIRKQWYMKHQPKREAPQEWGYARRGVHGEKYLVEALRAANVPLVNAWPDQWSIHDEKRKVSATPDGYIAYDDEWLGLEIKTLDPRTNRYNLPKTAHVAQLKICMALIEQQTDLPKGVVFEKGLLVYMDASNYDDIIQFEIDFDHQILDQMEKRGRKILRSKTPDALDREGKTAGGKECQTMCGFREVCGVTAEGATTGRKKANRGSNMDAAAVRYMEIKETTEALKGEQELLKEDIKDELAKRKVRKTTVGDIEIDLAITQGRKSLDKKAVKKAGIDLSPFEKTGLPSERLTLTRI